jgi:hypothetical protein
MNNSKKRRRKTMNEHIIKLGLESGMLNYVEHETPRHYFLCANADEECLENFVELVRAYERELCARKIDSYAEIVTGKVDDFLVTIIKATAALIRPLGDSSRSHTTIQKLFQTNPKEKNT